MTESGVDVRPAEPRDWETFRELRLASLTESPDSFRRVVADEADVPGPRWEAFVAKTAADPGADILIATADGAPIGLAFVGHRTEEAASIGGMWVDPSVRGGGVGRALLESAIAWCRSRRASVVRLAVTVGNAAAAELNAAAGFVATGETEPLRNGSEITVVWLERVW